MSSLMRQVINMTEILEANKTVTQNQLTNLVESLIESESQPGGPYLNKNQADLVLNARILKLFHLLNKDLPEVENYIYDQLSNNTLLSVNEKTNVKKIINFSISKEPALHTKREYNYSFFNSFVESLTSEVGTEIDIFGKKIISVDKFGEITRFSSSFYESLNLSNIILSIDLKKLGEANFMIWLAYSIYDSVIDGDINPGAISSGNVALRRALELYRSSNIDYSTVLEYIDKVDIANSWEVAHCRFKINSREFEISSVPNRTELEFLLENRAIAHIIGPLCIAQEVNMTSNNIKKLEQALKYYCIARQLNDDIHDWIEDFNNGRITFVLAELLRKTNFASGKHRNLNAINIMKKLFYDTELEKLSKLIETYIIKSISLLDQIDSRLSDCIFTTSYILPIGDSAQKASKQHKLNKDTVLKIHL